MAIDQVDQTVVTKEPPAESGQETVRTDHRRITSAGPGANERTRRIVIFAFGLIQLVIGARFVLLLLDAREANGLVSGVLNLSQFFLAPFEGILRTDSLHSAGSVFDVTAIVALVGWTVVELVVIWALTIFRREPA
ncbi:MAG: hypothetical protein ABI573_06850 [Chloroflexota bacterium]